MVSPFFDQASRNSEVWNAFQDPDHWIKSVSTYIAFHAEMAKRPGIEFVLHRDPEDDNTMVDGPDGKPMRSSLYIIRKQRRHNDLTTISPIAYYYCLGIRIFQAPAAANVLTPRILNLTTALQRSFERTAQLSVFSADHGHSWVKPGQAGSKKSSSTTGTAQQSREDSPAPTQDTVGSDRLGSLTGSMAIGQEEDDQDTRTLAQALRLMSQHRNEYADEMTLVGEPGSFRFTKTAVAGEAQPALSQQQEGARGGTPLHSRQPSVLAGRQTSVGTVNGRTGS
jgi:mediator of RNA polymerase II transcription subunit 6